MKYIDADKLKKIVESDNIRGEVTSNFASSTPFRRHGSIAYIRKDSLLEWLSKCKNNPIITDLQKGNIQELIDKINSM